MMRKPSEMPSSSAHLKNGSEFSLSKETPYSAPLLEATIAGYWSCYSNITTLLAHGISTTVVRVVIVCRGNDDQHPAGVLAR